MGSEPEALGQEDRSGSGWSSRRSFVQAASSLAAAAAWPRVQASEPAMEDHLHSMRTLPPGTPVIAMLIHPDMVLLDLAGPLTIFNVARFDTRLVWRDKSPVRTVEGLPVVADCTFEDCPANVDALFVPGGIMGSIACMNDAVVMRFLAELGSRAAWVTSICTGSLTLAAAGLLKGYDATAYWAIADLLPLMGARHVDKRVVIDRNRMTGAGVTAGIDFALSLVGAIKGAAAAKRVQLTIEYAPAPPYDAGSPQSAGVELGSVLRESRRPMDLHARRAAEEAANRLQVVVEK